MIWPVVVRLQVGYEYNIYVVNRGENKERYQSPKYVVVHVTRIRVFQPKHTQKKTTTTKNEQTKNTHKKNKNVFLGYTFGLK